MSTSLRQGDSGPAVGQLQQNLIEAGASIAAADLQAQLFGAGTLAVVRDFQARHTGPDGHALAEDGIVGPATLWAVEHPGGTGTGYIANGWRCRPSEASDPRITQVLNVAIALIGVHEDPPHSNRGPIVDKICAPELAIPWCAAAVSWCWARCDGGSPFGRILSALKFIEWGRANGRLVTVPQPGDIFTILRGDLHGHCGLVAAQAEDDRFPSLEGNSSDSFRANIRPIPSITHFIRPLPL